MRRMAWVQVLRNRDIVWELIPIGEIENRDVVYAFTHGLCDELAIAIWILFRSGKVLRDGKVVKDVQLLEIFTGPNPQWDQKWDGHTVEDLRKADPDWARKARHTLVETSEGLIDITGTKTRKDWVEMFDGSCAFLPVTEQDIADMEEALHCEQPTDGGRVAPYDARQVLVREGYEVLA
jgi:hypothetical protein